MSVFTLIRPGRTTVQSGAKAEQCPTSPQGVFSEISQMRSTYEHSLNRAHPLPKHTNSDESDTKPRLLV